MTISLKGKSAIVTGAAVGIGTAFAEALAREGANVAVCDVREEILASPAGLKEINNDIKAIGWVADVSQPAEVRRVVDGAIEAFGGIDILVNNAGVCHVSVADDPMDKTLADYDAMVNTNLKGEFLMGRAVIKQLLKQGGRGGDIVNVATDHMTTCGAPFNLCPGLPACKSTFWAEAGDVPRPTGSGGAMDIYDASKWGLNGFLFAWAKALYPYNIRVNALCMGATDSWMNRNYWGFPQTPGEETEEQLREVRTWMDKRDTAQVLIDLLKEGPSGRTAQNINLCIGRPVKLEPPLPNLYVADEDFHG